MDQSGLAPAALMGSVSISSIVSSAHCGIAESSSRRVPSRSLLAYRARNHGRPEAGQCPCRPFRSREDLCDVLPVDLLVAWAVENLAPPLVHPTSASRASPTARHCLLER